MGRSSYLKRGNFLSVIKTHKHKTDLFSLATLKIDITCKCVYKLKFIHMPWESNSASVIQSPFHLRLCSNFWMSSVNYWALIAWGFEMQTEMLLGFFTPSFSWALLNHFHWCVCFPPSTITLSSLLFSILVVLGLFLFSPVTVFWVESARSRCDARI